VQGKKRGARWCRAPTVILVVRLAEDDFVAASEDAACCIARVHDKLGRVHDLRVVVAGVVGSDHDAIVAGDRLWVERN
jgi:hypothetical protein